MNKLINKVQEYAKVNKMFPESGPLLICVSGGADSMCLLEIANQISQNEKSSTNFSIAVAHFNHQLRGEESDRDEAFVEKACENYGVPLYIGRGNVAEYAKEHGLSVEEAARDMRYEFFYETASTIGAVKIATAHTMDDNAETMLINLARGAGSNGMSGIPPIRDSRNNVQVVRPLLCISKDEVVAFVTDESVPYVDDSTNSLDIYTRNKVRLNIIPLIKELNPRFNEATTMTAELLRADESYISDVAEVFIQDHCIGECIENATFPAIRATTATRATTANITKRVSTEKLAKLPFAVSSRVIRKLYGGNLSFNHVKDVLELCSHSSPSASLSLPKMTVYREYELMVFDASSVSDNCEITPIFPTVGNCYEMQDIGIKIICKSAIYDENMHKAEINTTFTSFVFKSIDICGKMTVGSRSEGDFIKLQGQRGTKSLKKLFIEKRIPVRKRNLVPVISDEKGVLGIYKLGVGTRAEPMYGDPVIMLIFEEN